MSLKYYEKLISSFSHTVVSFSKTKMTTKKRGVSEVISSVLLIGITVAGAALISVYISDSNIADVSSFAPSIGSAGSSSSSIRLMGYDSRDTQDDEWLLGIDGLENLFDSQLCTVSCADNVPTSLASNLPVNFGTEFIVLQIRNTGISSVILRGMIINDESYTWDDTQAGVCLDMGNDLPAGKYPAPGTFSIIISDSTFCGGVGFSLQRASNVLIQGDEVILAIKLSPTLGAPNDLLLNTPLRIQMNTEKLDVEVFLITVGSIK